MKKDLMIMTVAAIVASLTGCGAKETPVAETTTTPAVTVASTDASAPVSETTTVLEDTPADTEQTTTTVTEAATTAASATEPTETTTSAPLDDLDAMMSSIEAEIPEITQFTGLPEITVSIDTKSPGETTTRDSGALTPPDTKSVTTTTVATTKEQPVDSNTDMFTFTFENVTYSLPVGNSLTIPAGWADKSTPGKSVKSYANPSYEGCWIEEHRGHSDELNGVFVHVVNAMKNNTTYPPISLAKGIKWGSTEAEITAAYGTPAYKKSYKQYGTVASYILYQNGDRNLVLTVTERDGLCSAEMYID